ncbi:hypothetical protein M9H77_31943 [Catharanthus roseus]|uniref:Uncharacterized protein n=1 Tax=Catharanthus roseus TaxID=4058 RepID=A0ACC0A2G7_CATRO|nr:hypothetical protein M9H77_31943 [Catharanthus roseus]
MTEHVTTVTQMVSDESSMLYPTVDDEDNENDHSDEEYIVSSESESDGNNGAEEEEYGLGFSDKRPYQIWYPMISWNDSMADIQLGMRFVDKVQAISARYLSQTSSKKYKYYFKWVLRTRGHEMYRRTYKSNFHPALNENFWRDVPYNLTFHPPNMNNERGQKQGTRFWEEMDYRNPDSHPRCGRCRMPGHNRKNCNNPSSSNV